MMGIVIDGDKRNEPTKRERLKADLLDYGRRL